jgi:hypothetical protein
MVASLILAGTAYLPFLNKRVVAKLLFRAALTEYLK